MVNVSGIATSLEKILPNGYKVVTRTEKGALGCEDLTKIATSVLSPEGKLVLSREKGIFRNWSSDSSLMQLPKGMKGTFVHKSTKIDTPQILPNFSRKIERNGVVTVEDCIFRPIDGEGLSFIERMNVDNYGVVTCGNTKYHEPIRTMLNKEKHNKAMELRKKVFGF